MAVRRLSAKIHGCVQGVGFRYFTREAARGLGITGYVRNAQDESVEVVVEGEEGLLARFIGMIKQGPSRAVVENVEISWEPPTGKYDGFRVSGDG